MSAVLHNNRAHLHFLAMCVTYCTWTAVACAIAVAQAHDLDYPGPVLCGGSTGGERGDRPLDWGQKKIIARPKNTHICKPPFACQNVVKLTYSNLFSGGGPRIPSSRGGEGRGKVGEGGEREVKEGGEG